MKSALASVLATLALGPSALAASPSGPIVCHVHGHSVFIQVQLASHRASPTQGPAFARTSSEESPLTGGWSLQQGQGRAFGMLFYTITLKGGAAGAETLLLKLASSLHEMSPGVTTYSGSAHFNGAAAPLAVSCVQW